MPVGAAHTTSQGASWPWTKARACDTPGTNAVATRTNNITLATVWRINADMASILDTRIRGGFGRRRASGHLGSALHSGVVCAHWPPMDLLYSYVAFFIAYLIGSISFAVIISRMMGLGDPRTYGSKNPGATNVLRSGSKVAAGLTLVLDALKGFLPTALVQYYAFELGFEDPTIAFVGVAAFLGHLFPVFFKFQGGKGVATAAGVLLAYEPLLGGVTLATWAAIAIVFRYASLASLIAAAFAPFFTLMFFDRPSVALAVSVMSLLLIWRHWRNIVMLLKGKESRIGEKAPTTEDGKPRRRRRKIKRLHDEAVPDLDSRSTRSRGNS